MQIIALNVAGSIFLVVMFLFGLVKSWGVIFIPVLISILSVSISSLAMFFTSKAPSYDFFSYYFTLVIAPMFLFSGIFFPLETFPLWIRALAWFTPLTHFVNISRELVLGGAAWTMIVDLLWLMVFTLALLTLAIRGVRKRVIS